MPAIRYRGWPRCPAFRIENTCREGRYRIEKTIFTHPRRDALIQLIRFVRSAGGSRAHMPLRPVEPPPGEPGRTQYRLGHGAQRESHALRRPRRAFVALACSVPWARSSAGFAGSASDGHRELNRRGRLVWGYNRAEDGNVVLTGEVDLRGLAGDSAGPGLWCHSSRGCTCARTSLLEDLAAIREEFVLATGRIGRHIGLSRATRARRTRPLSHQHGGTAYARGPQGPGPPLPACRTPGARSEPTTGPARLAITRSGPATWWKLRAACWRRGRGRIACGSSDTSRRPRTLTATGRRINGSMVPGSGTRSRWARRPFRSCCWNSSAARACCRPTT